MCLTKVKGPFIAEKDIIVYKACIKISDQYYGSFQNNYNYKKCGVMKSRISFVNKNIEKGFHSVKHKATLSKLYCCKIYRHEYLCEFIIPKGSIYYKGIFNYFDSPVISYVYNQIKFSKELFCFEDTYKALKIRKPYVQQFV